MKTSICLTIFAVLFLASCAQENTSSTSPHTEVSPSQENDSAPPQYESQPVQVSISPEVQQTLQQYTPEQIATLASQISSHPKCTATAVQNYFAGYLDLCKAYYVVTDAELERLGRINDNLDRGIRQTDPNAPHNRDWADSFCQPYCN